MEKMTNKQEKVLKVIKGFIKKNQYPPTHMEIAEIMGYLSVNSATEHLAALEKKGKIKRNRGVSRGLVVL